METAIGSILVLGGGSAGFLSAITLKKWVPHLNITVVRSPQIGIIGVGEGTTVAFTTHLHGHLGLDPGEFLREVDPIWKLGGRFFWGTRPYFDYGFCQQLCVRYPNLTKPTGFYVADDMSDYGLHSAMMQRNRVFARHTDGRPRVDGSFAYHIENVAFVSWLEKTALRMGIDTIDGTANAVRQNERGISALVLADGRELAADFFVDASGFASILLGKALGEEFLDYKTSLWCDRAIVGGWERTHEPIQPYTTQDTMKAGWSWRIDHRKRINRGYVFSSAYLTDHLAEEELRRLAPRIGPTRVVHFRSGRFRCAWRKNVAAVGNAFGFVEPLEATALGVICHLSQTLGVLLHDGQCALLPTQQKLFNTIAARSFDQIRWFLSIHYKFNDRLDTPFWKDCRSQVDFSGAADVVDFYRENGPTLLLQSPMLDSADPFGTEGYLAILLGQRVPFRSSFSPSEAEQKIWAANVAAIGSIADQALGIDMSTKILGSSQWAWNRATFLPPH